MSEINDRTPNLNLAQPHLDNDLAVDVLRIRESFSTLDVAVHEKAPLDSPELTGTPKAPTPPLGTNNNQIATMEALSAAISSLVASSPAALNTLKELAQALGNDPNFATTMLNALANKAPLTGAGTSGTWPIAVTGNAATATKLAAARTINGVVFDGSANIDIPSGATGGGTDKVFFENDQTVSANYTITAGKNAMSAGPIIIATGVTVTVPYGSTWTVV